MAKILFPGVVLAATPYQWYINGAPFGATWTATFYNNGASAGSATGSITVNGVAVINAAGLAAGTGWEVAINCSDGTFARVPVQSLPAWTFVWQADYSASLAKQPRVRKAQFGDGYSQRRPDGINVNPESWDLSFTNLTQGEAGQIMLFLDSMGGYRSFSWTNPDGFTFKYTCDDYGRTDDDIDNVNVRAKFVQAFF